MGAVGEAGGGAGSRRGRGRRTWRLFWEEPGGGQDRRPDQTVQGDSDQSELCQGPIGTLPGEVFAGGGPLCFSAQRSQQDPGKQSAGPQKTGGTYEHLLRAKPDPVFDITLAPWTLGPLVAKWGEPGPASGAS